MSISDTQNIPPSTVEERLKRLLVPPRLDLARITRRELRRGEPELRLLPFLIDRDRAAMDIGANRGIWAGQMAKLCPAVWAFEPNPKLFAVLSASAASNVACRSEALSDQDGGTSLLVPGSGTRYSNQGASLSPIKVGDQPHMRVPVTMARLDSLSPPPTGLLKIDVEGHERAMIEGATELISRDKPTLIVEIEERHTGRPLDEDLDYIESLGYRMYVLLRGRLCGRHVLAEGAETRAKGAKPHGINNFIFLPKD